MRIFNDTGIRNDWNMNKRYNLLHKHCNDLSNAVMKALGVGGIDQEYLNAAGLRKWVQLVPGAKTIAALFNSKTDQAVWDAVCDEAGVPRSVKDIIADAHKSAKAGFKKLENIPKSIAQVVRKWANKFGL